MEHPLNWILVIVAGAFFLLLFVAVIKSVTQHSTDVSNVRAVTDMDALFEASQSNPSTVANYSLKRMETRCRVDKYEVEMGDDMLEYPFSAIFSPAALDGDTVVWSEEFRYPGPVTTITYMLPVTSLILLVDYPTDIFDERVAVKGVDFDGLSSFDASGFDPVIVVNNPSGPPLGGQKLGRTGKRTYGIELSTTTNKEYGTAKFYSYGTSGFVYVGESPYLTSELMVGAVVSTSNERYDCMTKPVQDRLQLISEIQSRRILAITTWDPLDCVGAKDLAKAKYDGLASASLSDAGQMTVYDTAKNTIITQNSQLRVKNCPMLY